MIILYHDILIVGGGASGITAAIAAKDLGGDAAILESNDRIGKKLLTTGNGRCNITNSCINYSRYHSENTDFMLPCLNKFNLKHTESFFNSLGLPIIASDDGKMYPMSFQASSVLDVLRFALEERDIPVYQNSTVKEISVVNNGFKLITKDGTLYECSRLILANGGKSAPKTGSDGSGFSLAKALGHNIITPFPALVQLKLDYKNLKALSGIKFDGYAEIFVNQKAIKKEFGEILFTDYGISGPPILQLSRIASFNIMKRNKVKLKIDIFHTKTIDELKIFLENHWGMFSYRSVHASLIGIINKKLISILLKEAGVTDIHKPCYELDWKEKKNILSLLKSWEFTVCDTNSFANAQVTAGGVDTSCVNNLTMESTLIKNLFFCGEILDVDGDCGGFNLQWAWSSGFAAGESSAGKL